MTWIDGHSARFPRLLRFLAFHAALGAVAGLVLAMVMIGANVAGLRDLMVASEALVLGSAMLAISFALTFASASMGTAIMLLPSERVRR